MKTLIIYDTEGKVISNITSTEITSFIPVGIPFMELELKEREYVESIDVRVEPHKAVIKERPASTEDRVSELEKANAELMMKVALLEGGIANV